jgi:hypothetical protein
MNYRNFLWFVFFAKSLFAAGIFDSKSNLSEYVSESEAFYEEYVAEQILIDEAVGLGGSGSSFTPPALPTPPADPPAPNPMVGYLPIVIVNDSGFADSDVYLTIIGAQVIGTTAQTTKMYMTFTAGGVGSYNLVSGSGSVPNVQLSSITAMAPHTYALYIPANSVGSDGISGARIYFQINNSTQLITYSGGALTEPSVLNQSLASYNISFDKYEFAYIPMGSPQIAADGTAVDFFCLPLYGFLSTPDASSPNHSGLYEPQSFIMKNVVPAFFDNRCTGSFKSAILAQWNNLFSPTRSNPIRILSPGSAMSVGTASSFPNKFDPNYFDNAGAYGFSLIQFLWSGSGAYYKTNGLYFGIPPSALYTQPGTCLTNMVSGVYTASIDGSNVMNFCPSFTTEGQSFFPAPSTANASSPSPTNGPTSYLIFASQNLNSTFAANLQGNQVSKLFEEAMVAGLLPAAFSPSNPLSNSYLAAHSGSYYKNSSNLPASAGGPWYSVYSEAIHYCGPIYAYGFDEPLYPNVLMQCTAPTPSTYIGITIGTCDLVP